MKEKPIEAGCYAIIVNTVSGVYDGTVVHVLSKAIPKDIQFIEDTFWNVDKEFENVFGFKQTTVPECQLMRIDDGEEFDADSVVSWDSLKGIWEPEHEEELA